MKEEKREEDAMKYREIVEKINRLYNNYFNDYEFYKNIYLQHINEDKTNIKVQCNYENAKKQVDNIRYYFKDYLLTNDSENIVTDITEEELDF